MANNIDVGQSLTQLLGERSRDGVVGAADHGVHIRGNKVGYDGGVVIITFHNDFFKNLDIRVDLLQEFLLVLGNLQAPVGIHNNHAYALGLPVGADILGRGAGLVSGQRADTPDPVTSLGVVGVRGAGRDLQHGVILVDRRGSHRTGRGEVTDNRNDGIICDNLLGNVGSLFRGTLVIENNNLHILAQAATFRVPLVCHDLSSLAEASTIHGILTGHGTNYCQANGVRRFGFCGVTRSGCSARIGLRTAGSEGDHHNDRQEHTN